MGICRSVIQRRVSQERREDTRGKTGFQDRTWQFEELLRPKISPSAPNCMLINEPRSILSE